ncbi:hypothetical protein P7D15_01990 [Bacillus cereus]|uniref:hypothetical protein n=1 Tax=Bacillus cereus TaxID=1396 RepID=UPI002404F9BF|nr:hypothetical protein [Bacillus cereus]MDF9599188.1 hypothetical protein [Bacillus cereus]MDG1589521.1 hypothetical protein [Bacillus cereus]
MMNEFLGQVAKHNVGIKAKCLTVAEMRNKALAIAKQNTEGSINNYCPNPGDYYLFYIELGSEHGFEEGAAVQLDIFYDYIEDNKISVSYRVFIEVNGEIEYDECVSLEKEDAEQIALDLFVEALDHALKQEDLEEVLGMKKFLGQLTDLGVKLDIKNTNFNGLKDIANTFVTEDALSPEDTPTYGGCVLMSVQLDKVHGFTNPARVYLDVYYDVVTDGEKLLVLPSYRVFSTINSLPIHEDIKYIPFSTESSEHYVLTAFMEVLNKLIQKGKENKERMAKFLLHTVVLRTNTGLTFYEANDLSEVADECDIEDILRIYAKGTNISHDALAQMPDDLRGRWFISHIHDNSEHHGYEFTTAKEVKDMLPELLKNAHTCDGDVAEGYVLVYPPHAVLVSL